MSEYIIELPNGGAADECIRLRGYEKSLYGYELREEIVRCRDCSYYSPYQDLCERLQPGMLVFEPDDGFCAWGEREDGDAR